MAIAFSHRPLRGRHPASGTGALPLLRGLSGRIAAAWRNHRALRELESLSYDMRKDIGFRSTDTRRR